MHFAATTKDNSGRRIRASPLKESTPYDLGAGHIRPNRAAYPGLIYDLNTTDYLNYLCGRGYDSSRLMLFYGKPFTCPKSFSLADFNYPTITIPRIEYGQSVTVSRTVTNVGSPSVYRVRIEAPPNVTVSVDPAKLKFKEKGEKKEFRVSLTLKSKTENTTDFVYEYGSLTWTNHKNRVRSPIVVNLNSF